MWAHFEGHLILKGRVKEKNGAIYTCVRYYNLSKLAACQSETTGQLSLKTFWPGIVTICLVNRPFQWFVERCLCKYNFVVELLYINSCLQDKGFISYRFSSSWAKILLAVISKASFWDTRNKRHFDYFWGFRLFPECRSSKKLFINPTVSCSIKARGKQITHLSSPCTGFWLFRFFWQWKYSGALYLFKKYCWWNKLWPFP